MTTRVHPLELTATLREHYQRYLGTTFAVDGPLKAAIKQELDRPECLVKGPYLEASAPFQPGRSLRELVTAGVAHPAMLDFANIHPARPLHLHQDQAFTRIVGDGRNAVVATGTGSGKTESFLYPILDHLVREREAGTLSQPGVRALLLYPMNALAADQLARLRALLAATPDITFGRYTGETPQSLVDGQRRFKDLFPGEPVLKNELKSRVEIQQTPPHILLTNFKMLDYLLVRPVDTTLFDGPTAEHWRFWVLDELHTYQGAVACDVAYLLRRLKDRVVGSQVGRLCCIGTSATMGEGAKDAGKVATFAKTLFGEPFEAPDLILPTRLPLNQPLTAEWGEGSASLYAALANGQSLESAASAARTHGVPVAVVEAARAAGEASLPQVEAQHPTHTQPDEADPWGGPVQSQTTSTDGPEAGRSPGMGAFLAEVLAGDRRLRRLLEHLEIAKVAPLADLAPQLFPDLQPANAREATVHLIDLAAAARRESGDSPLLPARYHVFARALEGAFVTFANGDANQPVVSLERVTRLPVANQEQAAFELSSCRRCGAPYLAGSIQVRDDQRSYFVPDERGEVYLRWDTPEAVERDEDDEVIEGTGPDDERGFQHSPLSLCQGCGALLTGDETCGCQAPLRFQVERVQHQTKRGRGMDGKLHRCPRCHYRPRYGEAVTRLQTGKDAPPAVLATALYQKLPPGAGDDAACKPGEGRKLIAFADSRQDAAFFAPYLDTTYAGLRERRLVMQQLEGHPEGRDLKGLEAALVKHLVQKEAMTRSDAEREAGRWVIQDFRSGKRRMSLVTGGRVRYAIAPEAWPTIPEGARQALGDFLGFAVDETVFQAVIGTLLDTLRLGGVTTVPEHVDVTAPAFAPLDRALFVRESGRDVKASIMAWLPAKNTQNARLDYLQRLATKQRPGVPQPTIRQDAHKVLAGIWKWVTGQTKLLKRTQTKLSGPAFQLDHTLWLAVPVETTSGPLYRCDRCTTLTANNVAGVCPAYRCTGSLQPFAPEQQADNHYHWLFGHMEPIEMRAKEHTAQLTTQQAAETQRDFISGQINALCCSTTFEMGVDVGDLQAVLMRNVPPETANYLQRAGRAGRRSGAIAIVVTFAQRRAHDLYHFRNPMAIIAGRMRPPAFDLDNRKLAARHLFALAFADLFRELDNQVPKVGPFFEEWHAPTRLSALLAKRPIQMLEAAKRIFPATLHRELAIGTWGWVGDTPSSQPDTLFHLIQHAETLVKADLTLFGELEVEASQKGTHSLASYYQRLGKTVRERQLLAYLGARGLLPTYGFPLATVELQVLADMPEGRQLDLDRDLKLAIGEFAPGSRLVAAGKVWQSVGLKRIPNKEWPTSAYLKCEGCGWLHLLAPGDDACLQACPNCHSPLGKPTKMIIPEFGFVTDKSLPDDVGEERPPRGYSSRVAYTERPVAHPDGGRAAAPDQRIILAGRPGLTLIEPHLGELVVLNPGPAGRGFNLCHRCGREVSPDPTKPHTKPYGGDCKGMVTVGEHLGHLFLTDVLVCRFTGVPESGNRQGHLSLLYALLEGAARGLDIRRDDLDGCLHVAKGGISLILFDNVSGGAGHMKRVAADMAGVLQAAYEVVANCACGADTACYECLRNYRNQSYHDQLARGPVADYLQALLAARS